MWTPNEIRKLIAQFAGIVFGIGGIALMMSGIKATGKINISTNIISGEIESGSAGLLLLFFSFFLIVIPSFRSGKVSHSIETNLNQKDESRRSKEMKKLLKTSLIGTAITLALFFGGQILLDNDYKFGSFLMFGGVIIGIITGFIIIGIGYVYVSDDFEEIEIDKNPTEEKKS
jgi:F0F1-type ATP synthase assembly protein I